MISSFVRALVSAFKARRELALENVDLRQQLAVLPRSVKGPRVLGCPFPSCAKTRLCLLFIHPRAPNLINLRPVLALFAVGDVYVSLCKKKRLRST